MLFSSCDVKDISAPKCPHRLSDKLLKSSCDAAYSLLSRGGVYYAFLFQSQPLFEIFSSNSSLRSDSLAPCRWRRIIGSSLHAATQK
ncbi:hypothetical protein C7G83_19440 [Siccibacter turicensis]|uniref:Uncharacterized protein n=1 Tax=Siccibacter turicensis TaxID=357233 RepID=A0A2P8VFN4_9ENTR|nr:hypothetical protein C7G83_19440 [Siccibacter turicensis]